MAISKKTAWMLGLAGLVVAAQIGLTPGRSEDLRVAVLGDCPVSKGTLESGGSSVDIPGVLADAAAGAVVQAALQITKAYGQPQVSVPRTGNTGEHFHLLTGKGELRVNKNVWSCLVVSLKDLRSTTPDSAKEGAARDPHVQDRVYLEARILHAADGRAFELQPVTLRFREAADPAWLGSAARDLRFEFNFSVPDAKEPFAQSTLAFSSLLPSRRSGEGEWGLDKLGADLAKRSGWISAPPTAKGLAERAAELKARTQGEAPRITVHTPVTVAVSVVETRQASLLWKLVGDVLEAFAGSDKPASP